VKTFSSACGAVGVSTLLWASVAPAQPSIQLQVMSGPNGEQVHGSTNFMRMTRNGRFILFTNSFGAAGNPQYLHLTDRKSGATVQVSEGPVNSTGAYGVSDDGQYVAYHALDSSFASTLQVKDMSNGRVYPVAELSGQGRVFLSRSGAIAYVDAGAVVLDDFFAPAPVEIRVGAANQIRLGGMSADGTRLVLSARNSRALDPNDRTRFFQTYLYDVPTQALTALSINASDTSLRHMNTRSAAINAQGTHVAILYDSPHHTVSTFDVVDLEVGTRTLLYEADFDVDGPSGADEHYGGVDISRDGRFLSFQAHLAPTHPEFARVTNGVYDRIFRLDVATGEILTISRTHDGSTPSNFVNLGSYISSDGRHVGFAAAAKNLVPVRPISAEEPYHATLGDHVANYAFVGLPNSDQSWTHFSSMELVGDHQWEGVLHFDGDGNDRFKFDVGGSFNGLDYTPAANWSQNYGDDDRDGRGDWFGADIRVAQGAGRYRITFDDQTRAYTVQKLPNPAGDVRVAFRCDNGLTSLGQSVYVVGNVPALGDWDPARAVRLEPQAYPRWTGEIALPAQAQIDWKCIKRDEQNPAARLVWEPGSDNRLDTGTASEAFGAF